MRKFTMPAALAVAALVANSGAFAQQNQIAPLHSPYCHGKEHICASALTVDVNGTGSVVEADVTARASQTTIYQYGDNGKVDVEHRGVGGELIVFGNYCPPGTRAEPITHHGTAGSTRIAVARCR